MTACEYLAYLQTEGNPDTPRVSQYDTANAETMRRLMQVGPEDVRDRLSQSLPEMEQADAELRKLLPTPYQSIADYRRLLRAKQDFERGLATVPRFAPVENLVFGSRETKDLNAFTCRMPDTGEHLIVFNRGILAGALVITNLLLYPLRERPEGASGRAHYEIDPRKVAEFAPRFAHAIQAIAEGKTPDLDITEPFGLKGEDAMERAWTLWEDAATEFVFAHEYAHILCGHLEERDATKAAQWGFEYQADTEALDLVGNAWFQRYHSGPWPLYVAQGTYCFFETMLAIEEYRARVMGDAGMVWSPGHSHPPSSMRWLRLRGQMNSRVAGVGWAEFLENQLATIAECMAAYKKIVFPSSRYPHTGISLEQSFQVRMLGLVSQFYVYPQEMLTAMECCRGKGESPSPSRYREAVERVKESLQDPNIEFPDTTEPPLELISTVQTLKSRMSRIVGESSAERMFERTMEVVRHDAASRYGKEARKRRRRTIQNDAVLLSPLQKPNTVRLQCPHCGTAVYADPLSRNEKELPARCLACGRDSDYSEGVLRARTSG